MRTYTIVIGNSNNMKELPDQSIDLTITSPPYFDLVQFKDSVEGELSFAKDKATFFSEIKKNFSEIYRVTKAGGKFVLEVEDYPIGSKVYGYPREIFLAGDFVNAVESTGFYLISQWLWKKFEAGAALRKFQYTMYANLNTSEPRAVKNVAYCFVFRKTGWIKEHRELDFTREEWKVWSDGLWKIENSAGENEEGYAIFPIELVKRFIKIYTNKGDTVLDAFAGTGTSIRAAYELGRSAIGYEIRPAMLDIIKGKVGFGQQPLEGEEEVTWKVIER